jgi:hypothetical protein
VRPSTRSWSACARSPEEQLSVDVANEPKRARPRDGNRSNVVRIDQERGCVELFRGDAVSDKQFERSGGVPVASVIRMNRVADLHLAGTQPLTIAIDIDPADDHSGHYCAREGCRLRVSGAEKPTRLRVVNVQQRTSVRGGWCAKDDDSVVERLAENHSLKVTLFSFMTPPRCGVAIGTQRQPADVRSHHVRITRRVGFASLWKRPSRCSPMYSERVN